jgi:molecular chaperone DnaK (HSP70)
MTWILSQTSIKRGKRSLIGVRTRDPSSVSTCSLKKRKTRFSPAPEPSVQQGLLLLDVTPLGLGVEDFNGHMCTLITRNRTIPTKTEFYPIFTNAYASQTTATIRIFAGEHKLTKYNVSRMSVM